MKIYFILLIILTISGSGMAQTQFLVKGKIEYERKINVQRQFEFTDENSEWLKDIVSKMPKFNIKYFELDFTGSKTMYKPGKREGVSNKDMDWGIGPAKENIIITDLEKQLFSSKKKVYEETYLIQDSVRHLNWKITDETRTIAGFECKKAVARICDSVYVVAFYTDEIVLSGGPESFSGLPGMILGLAIPRLYTTWFATKVQLIEPVESEFVITGKGKKINQKEMETTLQKAIKDWGKEGQKNVWWVTL
jgi:GLPGLI family protein